MKDSQLKADVMQVLEHPSYKKTEYTNLITDILEQDTFSKRQRTVLIKHMQVFYDGII